MIKQALETGKWALFVLLGAYGAVTSWVIVTGYEEMTVWTEEFISNKNAMYFIQPVLIAWLGGIYADRYKGWRSWLIMGLSIGAAVMIAWWRSTFNILGVLF